MFETPLDHTVEAAQQAMLSQIAPLHQPEQVPLTAALGRVLAQDVYAEEDVPAWANSAMDGYAVVAADLKQAAATRPVTLTITERLGAGQVAQTTVYPGTTIRIMTGAPVPEGADAVVPFEATDEPTQAGAPTQRVNVYSCVDAGANIRLPGEALQRGSLAVQAGTTLAPGHIAVLATLGHAHVAVFRRPKVAILATGDELVELHQQPGPGQIRNSNSYALYAQILEAGAEPVLLPIARDTEAALLASIEQGINAGADLFVSSGGVSVGDHDIVRQVLASHGAMTWWKVRMRPGKPVMFGFLRDVPLLGLPGNPVSAMVCFELFGRPIIRTLAGTHPVLRQPIFASLAGQPIERSDRRQYIRVQIHVTPNGTRATPAGGQGSGMISSMALANGLLIIEAGRGTVQPGERLPALLLAAVLPSPHESLVS